MTGRQILIIGPFSPGQLPESFARAFEALGFEVVRFDSDRAYLQGQFLSRYRALRRMFRRVLWRQLNQQTVATIRRIEPTFVLAVKGTYLNAESIHYIRSALNVPIGNYYSDHPYCGTPLDPTLPSAQRRDLLTCLRAYTKVWIWEHSLAQKLANDHVSVAYLPFGADSTTFRPTSMVECRECGIAHAAVFVGKHSKKREAHVSAVRRHSIALWGRRWRSASATLRTRHVVHQHDAFASSCAQLYSSSRISLNVLDDLNMPGHNMRTFEIPASGGLMLSTYTDEQAAFFPENEAALYYRDPSELDDQIDRVLGDTAWAARLRANAAAIAVTHDYRERAKAIAADLDR